MGILFSELEWDLPSSAVALKGSKKIRWVRKIRNKKWTNLKKNYIFGISAKNWVELMYIIYYILVEFDLEVISIKARSNRIFMLWSGKIQAAILLLLVSTCEYALRWHRRSADIFLASDVLPGVCQNEWQKGREYTYGELILTTLG